MSDTLVESLGLSVPPVAVSFPETIPIDVPLFRGSVPANCRFWQEATGRVFATIPENHDLCSIGVYTHHLPQSGDVQIDLQDALKVFGELGYVRPEDMPFIPVLERKAHAIVYGPLALIPLEPDIVLLFVNGAQALVLSEASQQLEAGLPPALGRPACAIVPQAFNTGRTALSLGCCGARAYLDLMTPDVTLYAIPGSKLEGFIERVGVLAKANVVLTRFHSLRREAVEAGRHPSVSQSLSAL